MKFLHAILASYIMEKLVEIDDVATFALQVFYAILPTDVFFTEFKNLKKKSRKIWRGIKELERCEGILN